MVVVGFDDEPAASGKTGPSVACLAAKKILGGSKRENYF
jgi:hypothetical protein